MPTNSTALLTASLLVILILALLVNYSVHKHQERKRQRLLMVKKIKHEVEKILDVLSTLKQLQCPTSVINLFNNHVVHSLTKLSRLKPETGIIEQLKSQTGAIAEQTAMLNLENENAMKQAHDAIRFAIRFSQQCRSAGDMTVSQYSEICAQLKWLDSQIEIDTHISIGKRLLANDKPVIATSRFKQAKKVIIHLPPRDPRRQELMIEIDQLIAQALPIDTDPTEEAEAPVAG